MQSMRNLVCRRSMLGKTCLRLVEFLWLPVTMSDNFCQILLYIQWCYRYKLAMTGKNLEIISQIVLWYENSFRIDWVCRLLTTWTCDTSSKGMYFALFCKLHVIFVCTSSSLYSSKQYWYEAVVIYTCTFSVRVLTFDSYTGTCHLCSMLLSWFETTFLRLFHRKKKKT